MSKIKCLFFFLLVLILAYAGIIEPQWIEVTEHSIYAPVERDLKLVQISDLHTNGLGRIEKKVIELVNELSPDLIVLTGDVSSPGGTFEKYKEVLARFRAQLGVYFVPGNWEYWAPPGDLNELLVSAGLVDLTNKNVQINKKLWIVGFDDALEGNPRENEALKDIPVDAFKIGLFHSPVYFESIHEKLNVALSGHTHGGQVRIPLVPALWLPDGSSGYVNGWYSKGKSKMYVSRGIGTSVLPFRLFCRPEIAVFNLSKTHKE